MVGGVNSNARFRFVHVFVGVLGKGITTFSEFPWLRIFYFLENQQLDFNFDDCFSAKVSLVLWQFLVDLLGGSWFVELFSSKTSYDSLKQRYSHLGLWRRGSYDNFKRLQNSLNPKPLNPAASRQVVQRRSVGAEAGAVVHECERLQQQYENKLWKQSVAPIHVDLNSRFFEFLPESSRRPRD